MLSSIQKPIFAVAIFFYIVPSIHAEEIDLSQQIAHIEHVIQQDPGNRGVSHFYTTALFDAASTLKKAAHVAILTGFFIPVAQQPETDGPLGAIALAEALATLGKKVSLVTDKYCLSAIEACHKVAQQKLQSPGYSTEIFPEGKEERENFIASLCSTVDCVVSIERVGRAVDGTYRTMRALDITAKTAPLDDLFLYAKAQSDHPIATIAIGDGGNEIGMGNKLEDVKKYIPNGEIIACTIPSDHLIVTGVSNWGGYALAASLWCMTENQERNHLRLDQVFPSNEEQYLMLESMIEANCCDGVLGKPILSVDGFPWEVHQAILDNIRTIIQ